MKMLNYITSLGTHSINPKEVPIVKLYNQVYLASIFAVSAIVTGAVALNIEQAYIYYVSSIGLFFISFFILNITGYYSLSRLAISFYHPLWMMLGSVLFHCEFAQSAGIIGSLCCTYSVFREQKKWSLFFLIYYSVLAVIMFANLRFFDPIFLVKEHPFDEYCVFVLAIIWAGILLIIYDRRQNGLLTQLEEQNIRLRQKNVELEEFSYVTAHDIQEPLRTITAFSEMLHQKEEDPSKVQMVQYIYNSAHRVNMLIKDIMGHILIGRESKPTCVNANHVAQNIVDDLHESIAQSGAIIEIKKLPNKIAVYKIEFSQILQNLISNSIKYKHPDRITKINISCKIDSDKYIFTVKDNGLGIEAKYFDKIFRVFQRLDNNKRNGTGIGLANCMKIAALHQGKIWLDSELDVGTSFHFSINKKYKCNEKF